MLLASSVGDFAPMAETTEIEKQQQWTAMHLLIAALLQLLLVHIAYRIERRKSMPYISTSSWAIVLGIMVRASAIALY